MRLLHRVAVALAVLLTSGAVGHAAPRSEPAADDAAGLAASAWDAVKTGAGGLWIAAGSLFGTPDPFEYLPEQMPNRDQRFLARMDAAGYRLAAIDTSEGVLGQVRIRFAQQRAPSPEDLDRLRRDLAEHRARHFSPVAEAEWRAPRGGGGGDGPGRPPAHARDLGPPPLPQGGFPRLPPGPKPGSGPGAKA